MARVLVIGIDGASPALLERWMADGQLRVLASLRDSGLSGPLRTTPNMTSPSAWTSMVTGVNPGEHGVFNFFDFEAEVRCFRRVSARRRDAQPWWVTASRAGRRCVTVNMPCSWPAEVVNGATVAGWLAPGDDAPGFTYPPDLASLLRRRFGRYPLHSDIQRLVAAGRDEAARERVLTNLRRKGEIARWLLARGQYDIATVVFTDTDAAQHYYLHLTDPAHPAFDATLRERIGDVVLEAFREVDAAIGALVEAARPDFVLVVSDHGAAPAHHGPSFLPALFDALGWQRRRRNVARSLFGALGALLPAGLKHRIAARARGDGLATDVLLGNLAWEDTRAFTAMVGGRADVWLTDGGPERASVAAEVRETLLGCRDLDGRPVIEDVIDREDLYHGPHVSRAPHLLVRWRRDLSRLRGLQCNGVRVERAGGRGLQTGMHAPHGILIAAGKGLRRGQVRGAAVADIAPTVLHLAGVSVPEHLDGAVLKEISNVGSVHRARASGQAESTGAVARPAGGPADVADDAALIARLRGLGYL